MNDRVYSRAPDVVWRLGPDRVLVRRIGGRGHDAAAELLGEAALVWVVLDEAATMSALAQRLADSGPIAPTALQDLVRSNWLLEADPMRSA